MIWHGKSLNYNSNNTTFAEKRQNYIKPTSTIPFLEFQVFFFGLDSPSLRVAPWASRFEKGRLNLKGRYVLNEYTSYPAINKCTCPLLFQDQRSSALEVHMS